VPDEPSEGRRRQGRTGREASPRAGVALSGARSRTAAARVPGRPRWLAPRGAPRGVKRDTGPACLAQRGTPWWPAPPVAPPGMAPGRPWQHGQNTSWNGVWREGGRTRGLWTAVQEARRRSPTWREAYKPERPHGALVGLTL